MAAHGGSEWSALATDAELRVRAVREYAASVLGDDAADWLHRHHWARRCASVEGFIEAMAELARLSQSRRKGT